MQLASVSKLLTRTEHAGQVGDSFTLGRVFLQKARTHFLPRNGVIRIGLVLTETLVNQFLLPIGNRNVLRPRGDPIPQILHVIDLLIHRQTVESRWRYPNALCHINPPAFSISVSPSRVRVPSRELAPQIGHDRITVGISCGRADRFTRPSAACRCYAAAADAPWVT